MSFFFSVPIDVYKRQAVSCSDEDENRFRPGSTHEKPNPTEPEGGLDYSKLTADNHPRLLMNAEAFTALKAKVDANSSANLTLLHNTIMSVCNSKGMNATALTYKLDASNKRILDVSRDALLRIFTCAYAYRMTGDAKYLTKAETDMNAVCNFPDWNSKRHFLDVGEMATAVAFGYDWLYNELSAATRTKAANALLKFAFQQAQNKNWNLNFYEATNNWNQVCNGGLVCAALASYENNPSEAKDMIEKALESNKPALEVMYSPDGNYPEGSGYWCYGTLYQVLMLAALNSTLGTDNGLSDTPGFSKTAEYMLYMTGLNSKFFNYSDCAPSSTAALASWWFADKYSNPSLLYNELKMLKNGEYASCAENRLLPMIMAFANNLNLDAISAPSNKLWSGKGETPVVMVHTDWTYTDTDKYLGIKGGKAGSSHGHMDAGSFVYDAYGVRWSMDFGLQSYTTVSYTHLSAVAFIPLLLQYAEALAQTDQLGEAIRLVNKVRTRAHMPALTEGGSGPCAVNGKEDMLERIRYERRVEFCLEGINFFDEVRWGTYKETKFQGKDVNGGKSWWGDMVEYNWYYADYMWPWTAPIVETQKNPNLTKRSGWAY